MIQYANLQVGYHFVQQEEIVYKKQYCVTGMLDITLPNIMYIFATLEETDPEKSHTYFVAGWLADLDLYIRDNRAFQ